jgi:hypothetical protein
VFSGLLPSLTIGLLKCIGVIVHKFDNEDKEVHLLKCAKVAAYNIVKGNAMKGNAKVLQSVVGRVCLRCSKWLYLGEELTT